MYRLRTEKPIAHFGLLAGTLLVSAVVIGLVSTRLAEALPSKAIIIALGGGILGLLALPFVFRVMLKYPYIILGVYGADLHKVLLNVLPLLWGQRRAWDSYTQIVDYGMAALTLATLLVAILWRNANWKRWFVLVPIVALLALTYLRLVGFLQTPDQFSFVVFAKFIGGNMLLLLMAVAVCRDYKQVRAVWAIWLITALILAVVSVWLVSQGATWKSARASYLALAGTRTARVAAVALIYLVVALSGRRLRFWQQGLRWLAMMLLAIPVFVTGSKAAFVGLVIAVGLYAVFLPKGRTGYRALFIIFVVSAAIILFLALDPMNLNVWKQFVYYSKSIGSRVRLVQFYSEKIAASPLFGSGIRSSYGVSGGRTHNVLLELFVQVGFLGPALFLLFLFSTLFLGWRAIWRTSNNKEIQSLIAATLLACVFTAFMAQITGEISDNRDLWLFSGLLLALYSQYGRRASMDRGP